jgi:hypothetical protein
MCRLLESLDQSKIRRWKLQTTVVILQSVRFNHFTYSNLRLIDWIIYCAIPHLKKQISLTLQAKSTLFLQENNSRLHIHLLNIVNK